MRLTGTLAESTRFLPVSSLIKFSIFSIFYGGLKNVAYLR
jgi:hypothetical protein